MMHDQEREARHYHAIAIAKLGDPRALRGVRRAWPCWEEAYHALCERGEPLPDPDRAWEALPAAGVQLLLIDDPGYPPLLREIADPPLGLYIKGDAAALLRDPIIAMVGTRRASAEGKSCARKFGRALAAGGCAIASGLAFGIDAASHEGCLDAGGIAVAVLAGGLGSVYPRSNERLSRAILAQGGALVAEYPLAEQPLPYRFLERNRIVSGLARGTLVIESPESSGALATARFAFEQNRELFVLPGSATDFRFKGSHALIRQGAELVTAPGDIFAAYGMVMKEETAACVAPQRGACTAEEAAILDALAASGAPADVDKIVAMTKLEPRIVNQTLTFLIFKEFIKEEGGGYSLISWT